MHFISSRFEHVYVFVAKVLNRAFSMLKNLNLRDSRPFNDFIIQFYTEIRKKNVQDSLDLLFKQLIEGVDIVYFMQHLFGIPPNNVQYEQYNNMLISSIPSLSFEQNVAGMEQLKNHYGTLREPFQQILENPEFQYFLYLLEKHQIKLEVRGLILQLFPLFLMITEQISPEG